MTSVQPFSLDIPAADIADLKNRLAGARWPEAETVEDWSQGLPLAYHREFCHYWGNEYDWYQTQERLNHHDQFITDIDGLDIHFLHIRSSHENAMPLIITHGWPGSIIEFHKILEPLTEPTRHGGSAEDAFHLVCPSLPGYGFSGKPKTTGWGVEKIAAAWDTLMLRIGYDSYVAQGGDWGSAVTTTIGMQDKGHCIGIHVNMPNAGATRAARENPDDADKAALAGAAFYQQWDSGYSKQQSTRPPWGMALPIPPLASQPGFWKSSTSGQTAKDIQRTYSPGTKSSTTSCFTG